MNRYKLKVGQSCSPPVETGLEDPGARDKESICPGIDILDPGEN